MAKPGDVAYAVGAGHVADGEVDDLQIEPTSSEEQIEVPERVEVAEEVAVRRDLLVAPSPQHLGATQGVLDRLLETMVRRPKSAPAPEAGGQSNTARRV